MLIYCSYEQSAVNYFLINNQIAEEVDLMTKHSLSMCCSIRLSLATQPRGRTVRLSVCPRISASFGDVLLRSMHSMNFSAGIRILTSFVFFFFYFFSNFHWTEATIVKDEVKERKLKAGVRDVDFYKSLLLYWIQFKIEDSVRVIFLSEKVNTT